MFGLRKDDANLIVPNVCGSFIGMFQLLVIFAFSKGKKTGESFVLTPVKAK
jgi:hypothetical protein